MGRWRRRPESFKEIILRSHIRGYRRMGGRQRVAATGLAAICVWPSWLPLIGCPCRRRRPELVDGAHARSSRHAPAFRGHAPHRLPVRALDYFTVGAYTAFGLNDWVRSRSSPAARRYRSCPRSARTAWRQRAMRRPRTYVPSIGTAPPTARFSKSEHFTKPHVLELYLGDCCTCHHNYSTRPKLPPVQSANH